MIIRVTPQELKNQSKQVIADIKSIESHWKSISALVNGSKKYWEGDASNTHIRIYKDVEEDVNKIIKRLKENPAKLEIMAGVYDEAEHSAETQAAKLPTDVF